MDAASASHFRLLGLPPAAHLDEDALRAAYLTATRQAHPDQPGGDSELSARLNAAVEALRSPDTRLRHLIDTESHTPWRAVPLEPALMDLFQRIAATLQSSAALIRKKSAASTALAKALLAPQETRMREDLEALNEQITAQWRALEAALPPIDTRLRGADPSVWAELQALQAKFAYLAKWRNQIRESLLGLML
jgi:curved DNA-binding protein CbpA